MKPSIPKGTRDFSPLEMASRNFIFNTIRTVYEKYGFQQIETPAMENIDTLTGKYGEEGDKLIFKVLNSGNYFSDLPSGNFLEDIPLKKEVIEHANSWKELVKGQDVPLDHIINPYLLVKKIADKALRYDLTVPFARYVVMHQNEITFPFKRYQIQPVWRADRPQKGRYREFYQCDADVIGSTSLLNEVELVQIIDEVFKCLGLKVVIKINNRKILSGIAEVIGEKEKIMSITIALDKLDKIGEEKVLEEMMQNGASKSATEKIKPFLHISGSTEEKLLKLKELLDISETGRKGIEEVETIVSYLTTLNFEQSNIELDFTLARGLNYYTGAIFEVKINDQRSNFNSSVLGGGRYDNLTGIFGLPNVSGVGISFGVDRIYDVMDECKLFDELQVNNSKTKILFVNFGSAEEKYCLQLLRQIRENNINAEIYPDCVKIKKQMSYADDNKIPFVAIIGSEEMQNGLITLKSMQSGEQEKISLIDLIEKLK